MVEKYRIFFWKNLVLFHKIRMKETSTFFIKCYRELLKNFEVLTMIVNVV